MADETVDPDQYVLNFNDNDPEPKTVEDEDKVEVSDPESLRFNAERDTSEPVVISETQRAWLDTVDIKAKEMLATVDNVRQLVPGVDKELCSEASSLINEGLGRLRKAILAQ